MNGSNQQETGVSLSKGQEAGWEFTPTGKSGLHLQTSRAWAIKECLRDLWNYQHKDEARQHWQAWHAWAIRSRLKPVIKVARMIQAHLENVLTYCEHRITNATIEGLNSKIQAVKKTPMVSEIGST